MKCIDKLIDATKNKKIGNHRVEINQMCKKFYYYSTPIAIIQGDILIVDDGGYDTKSTKRAINEYINKIEHDILIDERLIRNA